MWIEVLESRRLMSISPLLGSEVGSGALLNLAQITSLSNNRMHSVHLTGAAEVPPRDTQAQGQFLYRISRDGTEISFKLIVANIDKVVSAHIHLGGPTEIGPVVVPLMDERPPGGGPSNGVLSTGTITAADLTGPLAGQPLSALIAAIQAGNTYVNVHTNDGVGDPNTGPGDFPGGEIRATL